MAFLPSFLPSFLFHFSLIPFLSFFVQPKGLQSINLFIFLSSFLLSFLSICLSLTNPSTSKSAYSSPQSSSSSVGCHDPSTSFPLPPLHSFHFPLSQSPPIPRLPPC